MHWLNGGPAWEAKSIAVESAHQLFESGRICSEIHCTARSELAFKIERQGQRWEAGFCCEHGIVFASMAHEGYTISEPRRLADDEALAGPLVQAEGDGGGEDDAPTRRRAPRRASDPRRRGGSARRDP